MRSKELQDGGSKQVGSPYLCPRRRANVPSTARKAAWEGKRQHRKPRGKELGREGTLLPLTRNPTLNSRVYSFYTRLTKQTYRRSTFLFCMQVSIIGSPFPPLLLCDLSPRATGPTVTHWHSQKCKYKLQEASQVVANPSLTSRPIKYEGRNS